MHRSHATRTLFVVVIGSCLLATSGCIGLLSNLMHAAHGNLIPPAFTGLNGKKVAVVCVSNSSAFGPTVASSELARRVSKLLAQNVGEIEVTNPQEVADWVDQHDWDFVDYPKLGHGVNAEIVVAIDLERFSLHEGQTMFKGRADVEIVVYDLVNGDQEIFTSTPPQVTFPAHAGYHTTDVSEREFRQQFMAVLASRIARNFYSYEAKEDYAADRTIIR